MARKLKSNFKFDSKYKELLKDFENADILGETTFVGKYKSLHCIVSVEKKKNGSKVRVISFSNDENTLVKLKEQEYKEVCNYFGIKHYKTYNANIFSSRPLLFIQELSPDEVN